jgi:hypothetical protein
VDSVEQSEVAEERTEQTEMNNDKAREFFSSYFEGTLDFGLVQQFEQKLRADADLMADYAAFVETMNELDAMRYEEIEVPQYLSDRIATRVEQVAEKSRVGVPAWMVWFRGLSLGAAATAAVAFAFIGLSNLQTDGPVATGSVVGGGTMNADHLNFQYKDGKVQLQYKPTSNKTVIVSSGVNGKELERFNLDGSTLDSALENTQASTALFDVQVQGSNEKATIAIPGTAIASDQTPNTGGLKEFAAALAEQFRVPVLLEVQDTGKAVSWERTGDNARAEATKVLGDGYSVDVRPSGMLVIMDR